MNITKLEDSAIFKQGYEDYYMGVDICPYCVLTEENKFDQWCEGNLKAYCEDEAK